MTRVSPAMACALALLSGYFLQACAQGLPAAADGSIDIASEMERVRQRCRESPQECEELKA